MTGVASLLSGLFVGVGACVSHDQFRKRMRNLGDVGDDFGAATVAGHEPSGKHPSAWMAVVFRRRGPRACSVLQVGDGRYVRFSETYYQRGCREP